MSDINPYSVPKSALIEHDSTPVPQAQSSDLILRVSCIGTYGTLLVLMIQFVWAIEAEWLSLFFNEMTLVATVIVLLIQFLLTLLYSPNSKDDSFVWRRWLMIFNTLLLCLISVPIIVLTNIH